MGYQCLLLFTFCRDLIYSPDWIGWAETCMVESQCVGQEKTATCLRNRSAFNSGWQIVLFNALSQHKSSLAIHLPACQRAY